MESTKKYLPLIIALVAISGSILCDAQPSNSLVTPSTKGEFFIMYGWNRAAFTDSNIRFKGEHYDFRLHHVIARDRPTPFGLNPYLSPTDFTIPQNNYRVGYSFKNNLIISIGVDHMKYVMEQDQTVSMSGYIEESGTGYDGQYDDTPMKMTPDFLQFEHTNGLNYVNIDITRWADLIRGRIITLHLIGGFGAGALVPRTNTTLLNFKRYDEFHLAGYGLSALGGLNVAFGKHFFIQSELKLGFINMPDIRTTEFKTDRASQHFEFMQGNLIFGTRFRLKPIAE